MSLFVLCKVTLTINNNSVIKNISFNVYKIFYVNDDKYYLVYFNKISTFIKSSLICMSILSKSNNL